MCAVVRVCTVVGVCAVVKNVYADEECAHHKSICGVSACAEGVCSVKVFAAVSNLVTWLLS